jgi:nucleoside-diphosphate-sugar epimerase
VRADLHALVDHARSPSRLVGLPARPAQTVLRALELARLSPLAEWHYKTAGKDSYVDVTRAEQALGWTPRHSNVDTLIAAYDWFLANEAAGGDVGTTHRTAWSQRALALLRRLS